MFGSGIVPTFAERKNGDAGGSSPGLRCMDGLSQLVAGSGFVRHRVVDVTPSKLGCDTLRRGVAVLTAQGSGHFQRLVDVGGKAIAAKEQGTAVLLLLVVIVPLYYFGGRFVVLPSEGPIVVDRLRDATRSGGVNGQGGGFVDTAFDAIDDDELPSSHQSVKLGIAAGVCDLRAALYKPDLVPTGKVFVLRVTGTFGWICFEGIAVVRLDAISHVLRIYGSPRNYRPPTAKGGT